MSAKLKNLILVCLTGCFLFGFAFWSLVKPEVKESISERRPLATFPVLTASTVMNGSFMTGFEKYTLDQFPLRDQFRSIKALTSFYLLGQKDNNDIYIVDGYASKLEYPMKEASIQYAANRFQYVYDRYLADHDMKIYLSVIPDKNYFMAAANGYPSMNYEAFFEAMRSGMPYADYIDIASMLELSDYYHTDAHWRQEAIVDVAEHLASEMGAPISADFKEQHLNQPFYGVYYGQSALPLKSDQLNYLDNEVLNQCTVYDFETESEIGIYDWSKAEGHDLYEFFLAGSKSLLTIENPMAPTQQELIVFRDSFGSSIAPILAQGYRKVTLVDIRYISPAILDRFITFDTQDVLFLYSTGVLNNSNTIK